MKKIILLCFLVLLLCSFLSCANTDLQPYDYEYWQQVRERTMWIVLSEKFDLDYTVVIQEDGKEVIVHSSGEATQRMVDMYNKMLRNHDPPILYDGGDFTINDVLHTPEKFLVFFHEANGKMRTDLTRASWRFRMAWYNGVICNNDDEAFHEWGVEHGLWTEDAR